VRMLARNPDKVKEQHPNLTVVKGDVLNQEDVGQVIAGTDLVISLFGHVKGSPPRLQTRGTENIVAAMNEENISRIISLSGGGLPFEKDQPKFADKAIRFIMKLVAKKILDDAIEHAEVLRRSGLDWTIVRAPRLTDEAERGEYRVSWIDARSGTKLSRADLASYLLELIQNPAYKQEMPFVAYA